MAYGYEKADICYYDLLKDYAKQNRRFQTDAEQLLWRHLRTNQLGLHFRRQHVVGCYIADTRWVLLIHTVTFNSIVRLDVLPSFGLFSVQTANSFGRYARITPSRS